MIVFLHNDLDAVGCEICIRKKFLIDKVFYTNYGDFEDKVNALIAYAKEHNEDQLIIADLSFAERQDLLIKICETFKMVLHIDHHSYPEGFFNFEPKCVYKKIINTAHCAAKLCRMAFKLEDKFLTDLIDIIDIYDCWRDQHKDFDKAQDLNNYFWNVGYEPFMELFKTGYPENYESVTKSIRDYRNKRIEELEKNNLIMRSKGFNKITFVFDFEVFNDVMINEMKNGQEFVIAIKGNIVKFRINQKTPLMKQSLEELRLKVAGKVTGHLYAFTYNFEGETVNEAKRIAKCIQEIGEDIPF